MNGPGAWPNLDERFDMPNDTHAERRFWSKVLPASAEDCWNWSGALSRGYGRFTIDRVDYYAHRLAYEYLIAPIPPGLTIDHLCRNRSCVNPWHMDPCPTAVNSKRAAGFSVWSKKTHCPSGHPYDSENTYVVPSRPTARYCRACSKARDHNKKR